MRSLDVEIQIAKHVLHLEQDAQIQFSDVKYISATVKPILPESLLGDSVCILVHVLINHKNHCKILSTKTKVGKSIFC
jgi:hypothetical protein